MIAQRHRRRIVFCLPVFLVGLFIAKIATAGHGDGRPCGCAKCGCHSPCQKICRLVKEEKKVTTTCWGLKCEDFCLSDPSVRCREHCKTICEDGDCKDGVHGAPKRFVWTEWIPSCSAEVHQRKKLMKRTVTTKVPSFKWVVEDLCEKCQKDCEVVQVADVSQIPPLPSVDAKVVGLVPQ